VWLGELVSGISRPDWKSSAIGKKAIFPPPDKAKIYLSHLGWAIPENFTEHPPCQAATKKPAVVTAGRRMLAKKAVFTSAKYASCGGSP
jgi:hypothetical protein